jgi:LysR family nitrogen assimilation transcriptional regulator
MEVPSSLRVDGATPMKRIAAAGLGYGLLPFSGIHQEVAAGLLSAALVPWIHADRVIVVPRARPVSRATREVIAALKQICRDLIQQGVILTTSGRPRAA